jgi:hypothetical protein
VLLDQALNPTNLNRPEAAAALEANGAEPELGGILVALDVDVRRLLRVARVEVKAIRPDRSTVGIASPYQTSASP